MEKELFEKLQLIAENYDKTSDLRSYVQNGKGMYLDEENKKSNLTISLISKKQCG